MEEGKWADRKRTNSLARNPAARRGDPAALEPVTSGRGNNGGRVSSLGGAGVGVVGLPMRKNANNRRPQRGGAGTNNDGAPSPDLVQDGMSADYDEPPTPGPQSTTMTPRISDIPLPLAKKYGPPPLPELKPGLGRAPAAAIDDPPSKSDHNEILKKLRDQKHKLPHERDTTPRRARVGSARRPQHASTPEPSPIERRYTDEGELVGQAHSALSIVAPQRGNSEAPVTEDEFDAVDPDTDGNEQVAVTGRRIRRIRVVVRKRPFREGEGGDDCVEVATPSVHIGAIKQRVDLSEYTENHDYHFDDAFNVDDTNELVYQRCGRTLIDTVFDGGAASCFAYGQTGSGKTHTMLGNETEDGMYIMAATDIFARVQPEHHVFVSLYEIYCNSLFDLLNYRTVVVTREDASKKVNIVGLTWHEIESVNDLHDIIERGAAQRRTGSTSGNEFSSRSHAVLTISLRDESRPKFGGSLNIVDLAGSERAADTAGNDKQTRQEGAEINKSLLALKECIRGLDERKRHIPFRGSKLTEVLRDSFVGNSRTMMVATISPSSENVEHTLNTLRYAFRVKGLTVAQVDPSKERNAPRVVPNRSKSSDPVGRDNSNVPTLPPIKERRKKKSRERKRGAHLLTPRAEQIDAVEAELKSEIDVLRTEMARIAAEKDQKVDLLMEQNKRMERELRMMRKLFMNAKNLDHHVISDDGAASSPNSVFDEFEE